MGQASRSTADRGPLLRRAIPVAVDVAQLELRDPAATQALRHSPTSTQNGAPEHQLRGSEASTPNGISVPLTGWLSRRFGEVKLFIWATLLFVLASFLCGIAQSMPELVGFRVLRIA